MCSQAAAKKMVREAQGRNYLIVGPAPRPNPARTRTRSLPLATEANEESSFSRASRCQGGARNYIDPSPYGTPALLSESASIGNFSCCSPFEVFKNGSTRGARAKQFQDVSS